MAYIAPSTTIQFFHNTGLSPNYENTLYFATESAKDLYFSNLESGMVGTVNNSYQRSNRAYVRVGVAISLLYDSDYMRFRNTEFEGHWFYAFVTAINYISNEVTEVEYQLDPMMTWMGRFSLKQCYIERQHVLNDAIGANIAEEGISTGPYVCEGVHSSDSFGANNAMIRVMVMNRNEAQAEMTQGVYNPTVYRDFDPEDTDPASETGLQACANFIVGLNDADLADSIVSIFMYPKAIQTGAQSGNPSVLSYDWEKPYTDIDGYVPKNKKLFVYPFKYLLADNAEGSVEEYKYEFFNTVPDAESKGNFFFRVVGTVYASVELSLEPVEYNGRSGGDATLSLGMSHFPQCAWGIDSYRAYLAQKNAYYQQDIIKQTASNILGFVPNLSGQGAASSVPNVPALPGPSQNQVSRGSSDTGPVGLSKTAQLVANHLIDNIIRPELGTRANGSFVSDLKYASNNKLFTFKMMSITKNYAKMIDDYFSAYGYKIGQIGKPNMNARPHWTYVKTIGADVEGRLPASDKKAIEMIFDNGIRFWHNLSELGNYSLDNSPA